MGEGYGEDNCEGACEARREHEQVENGGIAEVEDRLAQHCEKEVVGLRGRARPGHGISGARGCY